MYLRFCTTDCKAVGKLGGYRRYIHEVDGWVDYDCPIHTEFNIQTCSCQRAGNVYQTWVFIIVARKIKWINKITLKTEHQTYWDIYFSKIVISNTSVFSCLKLFSQKVRSLHRPICMKCICLWKCLLWCNDIFSCLNQIYVTVVLYNEWYPSLQMYNFNSAFTICDKR